MWFLVHIALVVLFKAATAVGECWVTTQSTNNDIPTWLGIECDA